MKFEFRVLICSLWSQSAYYVFIFAFVSLPVWWSWEVLTRKWHIDYEEYRVICWMKFSFLAFFFLLCWYPFLSQTFNFGIPSMGSRHNLWAFDGRGDSSWVPWAENSRTMEGEDRNHPNPGRKLSLFYLHNRWQHLFNTELRSGGLGRVF